MTVGHLAFAWLFIANLCRQGQRRFNPMLLGDAEQYRSLTNPEEAAQSGHERAIEDGEHQ